MIERTELSRSEQRKNISRFIKEWRGKGYEKGETQRYWIALLRDVLGVKMPDRYIEFERQVKTNNSTTFIDGYIKETEVLIEQKNLDVDLDKKHKQSDGSFLTPYEQAFRYAAFLPYSDKVRWIIVCNFEEIRVYDTDRPGSVPEIIRLEDLETESYRLEFLVRSDLELLSKEQEVSLQAGELVGKLYDELLKGYKDSTSAHSLHSLNVLCVRIVFCLYAEDAGIFGRKGMFHDYLESYRSNPSALRRALIALFEVLDQKEDERDPYLEPELAVFPYVNGGLFSNVQGIEIPAFNKEIVTLLLSKASEGFDWSQISPTIFGAVFESTLNPETRRKGGMHYTSVQNIHRVIDPLFLNELRDQLASARSERVLRTRDKKLNAFREKLASLSFLDPACGSGNFLTETYLSLRRLENEALRVLSATKSFGGEGFTPVMVSLSQFYGIEINDFACSVAKTALWIAESQMLKETEDIIEEDLDFLPLKSYTNICEGNALRIDWGSVVPQSKLNFIIGNPPFSGARLMTEENKKDVVHTFGEDWKNVGNIDLVGCWFKRAAEIIKGTKIKGALVATNSISQGEQVSNLWKPLFEKFNLRIDFAWKTFRWDNEASDKAHVHVVIIGFSDMENTRKDRSIFSEFNKEGEVLIEEKRVPNINAYLVNAPNCFIESRSKPICNVPEIGIGNQPIDDSNYLFSKQEMEEFIEKEPASKSYFKPWYGSVEFIKRSPRYCLWLGDCVPSDLKKMPLCMKRVSAVREFRSKSKRASTQKLAQTPTRFQTENMPQTTYIVIPETSSERRKYVPMGFMTPDVLCSNAVRLMPNATLYHFGVLTSSVHMAWMRAVAGRLKSDYRYSKDIVYNNFIWPVVDEEKISKIEETAQKIIEARKLFPSSSFADLYDDFVMPKELRKAHEANDKAVLKAYGLKASSSEDEIVAHMMKLYEKKLSKR